MDWTWFQIGSVLVLLLAGSLPAVGQDVRFGVRAGTSVSSFQGEVEDITANGRLDLSPTLGPVLTGFVEVQQGKWVFPRVGLTYVQKGGAVQGQVHPDCILPCPDLYIQVDDTYQFSYLEIPTIGAVQFPISESWTPEILAGQYLGVTLRADGPGGTSSERVRQTTYGLLAGVALEYAVGAGNAIALDVRYSRALTSLSSEGDLEGVRVDGWTVGLEYLLVP